MKIDKEQVEVYKGINDIAIKFITAIVFLGLIITITLALLFSDPTWQKTAPLGILDSILLYLIKPISKHFFPSNEKKS